MVGDVGARRCATAAGGCLRPRYHVGRTRAATEAEATVYRASVPARQAERALAVLAETVLSPLLTDAIVAHEREVIRHELADGVDDAERADELAARSLWGDHPLAADPAG